MKKKLVPLLLILLGFIIGFLSVDLQKKKIETQNQRLEEQISKLNEENTKLKKELENKNAILKNKSFKMIESIVDKNK